MSNSPPHEPPASMSSNARRLRQEPFDGRSARILCGVNLAPRNVASMSL